METSNGNIFRVTGIHRSPMNSPHKCQWIRRLNKRLSKQSWGWWFETPSRSLWRHRNVCSGDQWTTKGLQHGALPWCFFVVRTTYWTDSRVAMDMTHCSCYVTVINDFRVSKYLCWIEYTSWFTYSFRILLINQWLGVTNISKSIH